MLLARRETALQRHSVHSQAARTSGTATQGVSFSPLPWRSPWAGRSMDSTWYPLGQTTWAKASASSFRPIWPWRNR